MCAMDTRKCLGKEYYDGHCHKNITELDKQYNFHCTHSKTFDKHWLANSHMSWTEFCDHFWRINGLGVIDYIQSHHLSTQHRTLVSSMITVKERVKLCLMPTYRPRMVRNKGAILVLVFNFLIMNALALLSIYWFYDNIGLIAGAVGMSLIVPLAGWLADTRIRRFKVICGSVWIMWSSSVLLTVSAVLAKFVDGYDTANKKIMTASAVSYIGNWTWSISNQYRSVWTRSVK